MILLFNSFSFYYFHWSKHIYEVPFAKKCRIDNVGGLISIFITPLLELELMTMLAIEGIHKLIPLDSRDVIVLFACLKKFHASLSFSQSQVQNLLFHGIIVSAILSYSSSTGNMVKLHGRDGNSYTVDLLAYYMLKSNNPKCVKC